MTRSQALFSAEYPPGIGFTDTHCHIHDKEFFPDGGDAEYQRALADGVGRVICVGTDSNSSRVAVEFASQHENAFATVGIHPHDAKLGLEAVEQLRSLLRSNTQKHEQKIVVAIGEIGLDYFYDNSPRDQQRDMLMAQLELAKQFDLPVSFHVRNGFDDFWPIFDQYQGIRGVLHSYTDNLSNMDKGLSRGLLVGLNGISTFGPDRNEVNLNLPLNSMLLETDAPFLTPAPHRGKINEPAFVRFVAQYIADLRSISLEELSSATEQNAQKLFFK